MDEREKLIIGLTCGISGVLLIIVMTMFIIHQKSNSSHTKSHRQKYQRSHQLPSTKFENNKRKIRKKRSNTNESTISLSFNPPHLINQNVKNLDQLLNNQPATTTTSVSTTNHFNRCYTDPIIEPIYASSSSASTSISHLAVALQSYQQFNALHLHFPNKLDHVRHSEHEHQPIAPIKYSQSCRQTTDLLPFDFYRLITPSASSSNDDIRTTKYSNATLIRKARAAQLRDDTAIFY